MAEHSFQEVMRQLNRLCSHYHNYGESGCLMRGCPMFDECWNIGMHCSDPKHSYRIEKIVMDWAAENPEPVYPTWIDWLRDVGVIPTQEEASHSMRDGVRAASFYVTAKAFEPIPADIAQKLGLEPKENV